ncbi:MAG: FAD-dependent oxidoreductase [Dehalococcoidales bacterium]|nr:FAD-dependent oxidoreductase [Dehalococcoidales bacterium]
MIYDLLIVGGGPAGLAASVYAARKRLQTLLVSVDIGGQVNWTMGVENYLGYQFIEGPELIDKFHQQISQFPIDQKIGHRIVRLEQTGGYFEAISESGDRYQSRAVVLATGKTSRRLDIPGETKFIGKGVSYCAICDGPVFSGRKVAVIGGGNSALAVALDMIKIAAYVDLISLTPLTGDTVLVDKLKEAKNLDIFIEHRAERIEGQRFVEGLVVKDLKSGQEVRLEVAGIFVEIGLVPNSELVKGLLELNENGEVPVTCACETTVPGLYAAGDVTDVPEKQILIAAGEGAKAALQAHRYLQRLTVT